MIRKKLVSTSPSTLTIKWELATMIASMAAIFRAVRFSSDIQKRTDTNSPFYLRHRPLLRDCPKFWHSVILLADSSSRNSVGVNCVD